MQQQKKQKQKKGWEIDRLHSSNNLPVKVYVAQPPSSIPRLRHVVKVEPLAVGKKNYAHIWASGEEEECWRLDQCNATCLESAI